MRDITRADICIAAAAEAWRGAGEIMASPFGTVPMVASRLAKRTFSPDLVLTDGEAAIIVGAPPITTRPSDLVREAAVPYKTIFSIVWSGRRHIMMQASQIDRFGNQNLSAIGPANQPKVQLIGVRGAPPRPSSPPSTPSAVLATTEQKPPVLEPRASTTCHSSSQTSASSTSRDQDTPWHCAPCTRG